MGIGIQCNEARDVIEKFSPLDIKYVVITV